MPFCSGQMLGHADHYQTPLYNHGSIFYLGHVLVQSHEKPSKTENPTA